MPPPSSQPQQLTWSSSSSLSSHLAMEELKQRILTSLSKLSNRDTYQIVVEDFEKIIHDASADSKPAVKKEFLRLLAIVSASHADSGIMDACREAIGALAEQYLKGESGSDNVGSVVGLFLKPLFEAIGEQNKGVQSGAALCMSKIVDLASDPPVSAFQKLRPRICKLLNNPNFLVKASLLPVVSSLSRVGAIALQSLENLLPSIHDWLGSPDWARSHRRREEREKGG